MTDKDVITTFKKCINNDICESNCANCYFAKYENKCMDELFKRVLSVINGLQAENVQLRYAIKKERAKNNENDL